MSLKNDLELLDFDSLYSDIEDVQKNARRKALRKLRNNVASSSIMNNFFVGKEFANMDEVKERIRAYSVEMPSLTSKDAFVDKVQGPKENISGKGKEVTEQAEEDKSGCPWGFTAGGKELLGLDGAFMRGKYHRQMLTLVGMDANNGIYFVAYGIVE
ncbi:hypothetical protein Tco_0536346 [Tanacetum coccineum]